MITVILSGFNRGLGQALHNKLCDWAQSEAVELFFLARNDLVNYESKQKKHYLFLDLNSPDFTLPNVDVSADSKHIIFINNAATIEPISKSVDIDPQKLEGALRVNCVMPFVLVQKLTQLTDMKSQKLTVLNISSGAANHAISGWLAYCTSKLAIRMALDVLAVENKHVEIMHIDPGVMDTKMQELIRAQNIETMPDVMNFVGYHDDGILKSPSVVADDILLILKEKTGL